MATQQKIGKRLEAGFLIWSKGAINAEAAWSAHAIHPDNNHEHWRGRVLQCTPVAKEHAKLPLRDLMNLYPLKVAYDPGA